MEEVKFEPVKEGEAFSSTRFAPDPDFDQRPVALHLKEEERMRTLYSDLEKANPGMVILCDRADRNAAESTEMSEIAEIFCSPFGAANIVCPNAFRNCVWSKRNSPASQMQTYSYPSIF